MAMGVAEYFSSLRSILNWSKQVRVAVEQDEVYSPPNNTSGRS